MSGPPGELTVLIGPAGAGKSTLAAQRWAPGQVLSLDALRELASGDPYDQEATGAAVAALRLLLRARLRRGVATVVDATNASPGDRAMLLQEARKASVPAVAIVLLPPLAACLARNAGRAGPVSGARWGRRVPEATLRQQHEQVRASLPGLLAEGFAIVTEIE